MYALMNYFKVNHLITTKTRNKSCDPSQKLAQCLAQSQHLPSLPWEASWYDFCNQHPNICPLSLSFSMLQSDYTNSPFKILSRPHFKIMPKVLHGWGASCKKAPGPTPGAHSCIAPPTQCQTSALSYPGSGEASHPTAGKGQGWGPEGYHWQPCEGTILETGSPAPGKPSDKHNLASTGTTTRAPQQNHPCSKAAMNLWSTEMVWQWLLVVWG